jgi:4-hydroxybutyryl-CoA dehydratase/vinylacetyl-CoA-Delta-isomerase
MGIKTRSEYIESLRQYRPLVYIAGEAVRNVVDNPYFRTGINHMGMGYDWANEPENKDIITFWSPLVNERVSYWTHLRQTPEELSQMIDVIKKFSARHVCTMCMGIGLCVLWAATYEIDRDKGTDYHARFRNFYHHIQKDDLRFALGVMDPKGDRSLTPGRQTDPDLHLRIIEKRKDGIVVRGAKMHTTSAPCTHYFLAAPCRVLTEEDQDYAVAFAIPIDTKGLTFVTRPAAGPLSKKELESPVSQEIGFVECLSVFENVFVPWENVFMCGEWQYTDNLIQYFSSYVRMAKGTCVSARTDLLAGVAALIADYNGIAKASHVRSKLNDMIISSEIGWGCALGAVTRSVMHPSGIPIPDISIANAGLYHTRLRFVEFMGVLQEIAGGIVTTMPLETEYLNEATRGFMEKYLKGRGDVPTEDRLKALYLIQELTASHFSGYLMSSTLCAGGTPETNRVEVFRNYNLEEKVEYAKALCKIKKV